MKKPLEGKSTLNSNYAKSYQASGPNQSQFVNSDNKKKISNPYTFTRTNTTKNLGLTSKFSKKMNEGVSGQTYDTDTESIRFTRLREKSLPSTQATFQYKNYR